MTNLIELLDAEQLITMAALFLPKIAAAVVVLFAFWIVGRVIRTPLKLALRGAGFEEALVGLLVDNVVGGALFVLAVVMAASQLGINVAAALAGIGVVGIAVGFAAQDSLANMISGFLIFWDKPFRVGDVVTVEAQYGKVVQITMRTTRIRTPDNTYVIIPNKNIIDSVLINHSKHGDVRLNVPIGIAYKERITDARRVLLEAVVGLEGVLGDPAPDVVVSETAASSVDLKVRVWIADASQEMPVYHRVLEASKLALDAAGIQIPFPHLQLFVDDVEARVIEKVGHLTNGERRVPRPPATDRMS